MAKWYSRPAKYKSIQLMLLLRYSFMVSIMVVIFVKWVCSNQGCNGIDE